MNTSKLLRLFAVALAALIAAPAYSTAQADGKLHALVIGNSNYKTGRLRNPANDAVALSAALKSLGFEVTRLTDIGQNQAEDAIFRFSRSIDDNGLAFFFFAGHGVQVKGENYLIPVDARIREEYEVRHQCISLSLILDALENSRSNMNVVVLDCCRDNPFQRSWSRSYRSGLAATSEVPEGTLIAYATAPGQTAADGEGVNSPYTMELVAALSQRPDNGLLLRDAFFEASRNVKSKTGQSPWINMEASLAKFYLTKPGDDVPLKSGQPSAASVANISLQPTAPSVSSLPSPESLSLPPAKPDSLQSALEQQANAYLRNGDFSNAIEAFSAIIADSDLPAEARKRARKARGSAYLSRGGNTDFDRAIIDHKAAGLPGIRVPVRVRSSPLQVGKEIRGSVKRNQILLVTLSQGDWLWVQSINDDDTLKGYIKKDALLEPKPVAKPSTTSQASSSRPATGSPVINSQGSTVTQGRYPSGTVQGSYPQGAVVQGNSYQGNSYQGNNYVQQGTISQGGTTYVPQGSYRPEGTTNQRYYAQGSSNRYTPQQSYRPQQNYSQQSRGFNNNSQSRNRPMTFRESFNQSYNRMNSILNGGGGMMRPSMPTPFMRRR